MEIILLGIYAFFVWVIFIKLKLLPWNIVSQVIVITLPIIALTAMILYLNVIAPSSHDVRVVNYYIQVIPQVPGRVIEVPVEANRPVKKGDVLFKIDPQPFEDSVRQLEAKVAEAKAKVIDAETEEKSLLEQRTITKSRIKSVEAALDLANRRVDQYRLLASKGAGRLFDVEQAETNKISLEADLDTALSRDITLNQKLAARTEEGVLASVAAARATLASAEAQLASAQWQLSQTTMYAPADGTVINLQLRPGQFVNNMPFKPAMLFVEDDQLVLAFYHQNELREVQPGNEAEIALSTYPGRIIKCQVDSIVWAQGQGQLPWSGNLPETGYSPNPEGRFAVRMVTHGRDEGLFLAAGARGMGAIYTEKGHIFHLVRKIILRVGSKLDWLILKLH